MNSSAVGGFGQILTEPLADGSGFIEFERSVVRARVVEVVGLVEIGDIAFSVQSTGEIGHSQITTGSSL